MRVRGLVAAVVAGLALVATTALPARAAREVSGAYVTGTDPIASATMSVLGLGPFERACASQPGSPTAGGVCFIIESGETRARVRIVDATGVPVSGDVSFYDAAGEWVHPWTTSFCRRTDMAIPSAAAYVHVRVDASTLHCGLGSGVGTTGTVVAFFS